MKNILLIIFSVLSALIANAQQLANTDWNVYDTNNAYIGVFSFDTDSLSYSGSPGPQISGYTESGSTFLTTDNSDLDCAGEIGEYSFSIVNDTLSFTVVDDTCSERSLLFADFTWVNLAADINDSEFFSSISTFPNPTFDQVTVSFKEMTQGSYYVLNSLGQTVSKEDFEARLELTFKLDGPAGVYILHLEINGQKVCKRIIKV